MAPSSRTSTLSTTRARGQSQLQQQQEQQQKTLKSALSKRSVVGGKSISFGRVTKSIASSGALNASNKKLGSKTVKFSDCQRSAFEGWNCKRAEDGTHEKLELEDGKENLELAVSVDTDFKQGCSGVKRKRSESVEQSDSEKDVEKRKNDQICEAESQNHIKKRRFLKPYQLLTPPASRAGTPSNNISSVCQNLPQASRDSLPQLLNDFVSMHLAFVKALSLHYAHNGASSPAELNSLMNSMTRLWKKQNVRKDAFQKMLGLYEIAADLTLIDSKEVEQKRCPFKIVTSGLGSSIRTNLEYIGNNPFNELDLQAVYLNLVNNFSRSYPAIENSNDIPTLAIVLGSQTLLHRSKAATTRAEILNLSSSAQARSGPDFSKLSITDPSEHTPAAVKSRTLSLFDRVRAKGLVAAAAPTAEQVTRRHAIGRISEVVEFLRMKQQQKLSNQFHSSVHDSPGKMRGSGKVSFSLASIVQGIRQSVGVPIGDDEVRLCLRIISQETPGDWCRVIELGSLVSITLQGQGMSGAQVKKLLEIQPMPR